MMNGWYFLLWLVSVLAVFSIPVLLLAGLMRLVGRLGTRGFVAIVATALMLWGVAIPFWLFVSVR